MMRERRRYGTSSWVRVKLRNGIVGSGLLGEKWQCTVGRVQILLCGDITEKPRAKAETDGVRGSQQIPGLGLGGGTSKRLRRESAR